CACAGTALIADVIVERLGAPRFDDAGYECLSKSRDVSLEKCLVALVPLPGKVAHLVDDAGAKGLDMKRRRLHRVVQEFMEPVVRRRGLRKGQSRKARQ